MVDQTSNHTLFLSVSHGWMVHGSDLQLYMIAVLIEHPLTTQLCPPIIKVNKTFFIILLFFTTLLKHLVCVCVGN